MLAPRRARLYLALLLLTLPCPALAVAQSSTTLRTGVQRPVRIARDSLGISHIYARNEHDLFFAQGYVAATDRLFQLEMWRRQATGTVAELLGPREAQRDIGARLFAFRGDMTRELAHYHPRGATIIGAFVEGVNARITDTERDSSLLPIEFRLLRTKPGRWTPAVVVSRHQGLLGNIEEELATTRAVVAVGAAKVKELVTYGPGDPDLRIDAAIDTSLLGAPILALYKAYRTPLRFQPGDLVAAARNSAQAYTQLARAIDRERDDARSHERRDIGSNNWVVSGSRTASGHPIMANDPHRAQSAPSLRYWTHLVAPGWDVIGGGEPEIPGVSIGHNRAGAWGLTIFETDGEDLYVYATNPVRPRQYRYAGRWETMRNIRDSIRVKNAPTQFVDLRFTRHGPVVYEDTVHHVAYAVRAAWMEPGSAPYLASLRMDQARTWAEFRAACAAGFIPGENMVWADTAGNIGWQAVGIAPIRRNWSGLVAVPGDGRYEWSGYLPILEKPHALNPAAGFIATANNNLIPPAYAHMNAVGYTWADPFRWARIGEVLSAAHGITVNDMTRLQTDYLSLPARALVPLLRGVSTSSPLTDDARRALLAWDFILDARSSAAGIYVAWYRHLAAGVGRLVMPDAARSLLDPLTTGRVIDLLVQPSSLLGNNAPRVRDSLVVAALDEAITELSQRFGTAPSSWVYGSPAYHHALLTHPMSAAVTPAVRAQLNVGPAPRGGDGNTVGATGGGNNQTSGASFRFVVEAGAWDFARGTNTPGQSGDPASPHYRDLFTRWAADEFFPVAYSDAAVARVTESTTMLVPRDKRASKRR